MAKSSGRKIGVSIKRDSPLHDFSKDLGLFKADFGFGGAEASRYDLDFVTSSVIKKEIDGAGSGRGVAVGIKPKKINFAISDKVGNAIAKKVKAVWADQAKRILKGTALYDYLRAMKVEFVGQSLRLTLEGWEAVSREAGWAPTPGGLAAGIGKYDGSLKDMKPILLGSATSKVIPMRLEGTKEELFSRLMADMERGLLESKYGSKTKHMEASATGQVDAAFLVPKPPPVQETAVRQPGEKRRRIVDLSSGKVTDLGSGAKSVTGKPGPEPPSPYGRKVKVSKDDRMLPGFGEDIRSSKPTAPALSGPGSVPLKDLYKSQWKGLGMSSADADLWLGGREKKRQGPIPEYHRGKSALRRRYTKGLLEGAKVFRSPGGTGHEKGRMTFIVFRTVTDGVVRVKRPKHGKILNSKKYQEAVERAALSKKRWLTKGRPPIHLLEKMREYAALTIAQVSQKLYAHASRNVAL